jgi:hypothetical protein
MSPSGWCYGPSGRAEGDTGDAHNKYYNNNEMVEEEGGKQLGGGEGEGRFILYTLLQLLHVTLLRAF